MGTLAEAPKAPMIEAPSRNQGRIQKARLGATVGWEKGFEAETPKTSRFEAPSRDAEGDEGVVMGRRFTPPQPTRGPGSVLSSPSGVGGAEPLPKTNYSALQALQNCRKLS